MSRPVSLETLAVGDAIPSTTKVVFQRALSTQTFSEDSSHDDDNARKFGYPGALVSAYVLAGLMSEPMVALFGSSWFTVGSMSLTFIGKGVQQGDTVTCHGVITGRELISDGVRVTLDVWMEKDEGVRVVVGHTSGLVRGEVRREP